MGNKNKNRTIETTIELEKENIQHDHNDFDLEELTALSPDINTTLRKNLQSSKIYVYNELGLENKLKEIELPKSWPWIEKLNTTVNTLIEIKNIEDDHERETTFYNNALEAVKQAILQLEQNNIPYKRPNDYYAESIKPDEHMETIKRILINEKQRIESVNKRKREHMDKDLQKRKHAKKDKQTANNKHSKSIKKTSKYKKRSNGDTHSDSTFKRIVRKQEKQIRKQSKSRS